jgi:hypothetical protein
MSRDFVFVGPTLPASEAKRLLPAAELFPPVRHGDLLRLDACPDDRVLIVDGLFLQTASVRHREILYLLERGVTVAGSSSMGALRAAELWPYGMRGYGRIFELYRDGVIDRDDEVAITHGTEADESRAYSEPLVNIRLALAEAVAAQALSAADASQLLDLAAALPFRSRSFHGLEMLAGERAAAALSAWRSAHVTDFKAADARLMLAAASAHDQALAPAGPADLPIRNVHSGFFDMWEHDFHGAEAGGEWVSDADAAAAICVAYPGFREAYRRHTLSRLTGLPHDHPALAERAAHTARLMGLRLPAPDADLAGSWLTRADLGLSEDQALAILLARAFGTAAARRGRCIWDVPPALRMPDMLDWGRRFVRSARACNAEVLSIDGGTARRRFLPEAIDRAVAKLWRCEIGELEPQAWDRGILDLAALRQLAEPLVAHLMLKGVPAPPLPRPVP